MNQQKYEFLKGFDQRHITIGFGSYGQVKLAKNSNSNQLVAIKFIYNRNAKEEISMHRQLDHPNIVQLLNYYYEPERNVTYMVLEYINGGTLFQRVKNDGLSKRAQHKIFRQVCNAVEAMHSHGVMHRDIKPENILLTKNGEAKICDFGFATLVGDRKTLCGTYEYMAPEMIQNHTYGHQVDIWALGVLLFEIIEGVAPFRGNTAQEVLNEMKKNLFFSTKFSEDEIDLVRSILRVNPHNRPSIKQILQHKYFVICKKDSLASTCASEVEVKHEEPMRLNITAKNTPRSRDEKKNRTYMKVDTPLSPKSSPVDFPGVAVRRNDKIQMQYGLDKSLILGTGGNEPVVPKPALSKSNNEHSLSTFSPMKKPQVTQASTKQTLPPKNKVALDESIKTKSMRTDESGHQSLVLSMCSSEHKSNK